MKMKTINKMMFGYVVIVSVLFYSVIAKEYKFPLFLAEQWYVLCAFIFISASFAAAWIAIIMTAAYCKTDDEMKMFKKRIFDKFQTNLISPLWHYVIFVYSAVLFQWGEFIPAACTLLTALAALFFRLCHRSAIDTAVVAVLNNVEK